jgi:hypothetical protein
MRQLLLPSGQQICLLKLGKKKKNYETLFVNSQKGEAENLKQSKQTKLQ